MASDKYSDKRKKSVIMEWIKDIAIAAIIAIIIVQFIKPTIVKETSMEPNFYENNYLFVFKMSYKLGGEPKREMSLYLNRIWKQRTERKNF